MAQTLGQTAVGTVVKINENGSPVDFIVVQQGNPNPAIYSTTFNNGTWLTRNLLTTPIENGGGGTNGVAGWYNGSYKNLIDANIRNEILTVKLPWTELSFSGVTEQNHILEEGFNTQIFPPHYLELRVSPPNEYYLTGTASRLSYWNSSNSVAPNTVDTPDNQGDYRPIGQYWVRGLYRRSTTNTRSLVRNLSTSGNLVSQASFDYYPTRPCFLLPQNLTVLDDGTISLAAVPPASCTFYNIVVMQGQPVTINWTASANGTSYILQRKSSADADWVQVYSGSDLTFTETVGSNWTTVQYQVAAVMDGNTSAYIQSVVHDVVLTAALVISGEDGDLGTITSDVSYSITSDTGNQISITRKVNDVEVYSGTVSTGFTYNIPIVDLPSGADNTIEINASVQSSGGTTINETRTWTYTKTPITFSSSGGVSELKENDGAIWPATIQEAVRTYDFMGGTLDQAMMRLSNAVIKDPVTGGLVGFEGQDIGAAQIYVGSYVGTGTYGESHPTTITVPFTPIAIMIWPDAKDINVNSFYNFSFASMVSPNHVMAYCGESSNDIALRPSGDSINIDRKSVV